MPSKNTVKQSAAPPPPSDDGGENNDKSPSPQKEQPQGSKNKKVLFYN